MLFQDPQTMTDEELEAELMLFRNGELDEVFIDACVSDFMKHELLNHYQRVENECSRRDGLIRYPLEAFGITNFFND